MHDDRSEVVNSTEKHSLERSTHPLKPLVKPLVTT